MRAGPGPPFLLSEGLLRRLHSVFFLVSIKDMNAFPSPFIRPDAAPEMVLRFGVIMAGLAALIARRFLRMPHLMRFTLLLWGRLNRAVRRFHRALTQGPGAVRAARVRGPRGDVARVRKLALPTGRAWLVRELGWEAAGFGGQLDALLAEPGMAAVVAGVPAVGRVLRPICRMLGVVMPAPQPVREAENDDGGQEAGKNRLPSPHLHSQHPVLGFGVQGASLAGVEGAVPPAFARPREGPPAVR